jgi:hypothetical protein
MAIEQQPRGALLLGSMPLDSAEEVFRLAAALLGAWLRRIPDGETDVRKGWISWQRPLFEASSFLEPVSPDPNTRWGAYPRGFAALRLHAGVTADQVAFGRLGYADVAIASYALFARLSQEGVIPPHCRLQVSLPTPLAPVVAWVTPESQTAVEPAYETRLLAELDEIVAAIPPDQLAIQWDTAVEFGILEGVYPAAFDNPRTAIVERLVRIGERVPASVELGYHLCYGDAGHRHFKEPADTGLLVDVANAVSAGVSRSVTWLHMPVPRNRDDDAYFAPLRDLRLQPGCEFYLGLVHQTGGAEGTHRRITAAQQVVTDFGVATECGLGRRPPDTIPDLVRQHAEVAAPVIAP